MTILNAFANNHTMDQSGWKIIKYPEQNPKVIMNFDVGFWKCLVILAALTVGLRLFSMFFLKLLVSRF